MSYNQVNLTFQEQYGVCGGATCELGNPSIVKSLVFCIVFCWL